jgi:hypothetical protein
MRRHLTTPAAEKVRLFRSCGLNDGPAIRVDSSGHFAPLSAGSGSAALNRGALPEMVR